VGSGTTWTHQAELTASDGVSPDFFGFSVAISGSTAVVGTDSCGCGYGKNAAYVFVRSGTTWSQQAELGVARNGFGQAVAISGSTAVFGGSGVGAAYVFVRSGTTWSQQAELIGSDRSFVNFGASVAISGSTAVIGAPLPFLPRHRGAAYVFVQSGTTWTQTKILSASDGTSHQGFGSPVAISGSTALVAHFSRTSMIGAVYIFHV
jgi:FG-GAP repeat